MSSVGVDWGKQRSSLNGGEIFFPDVLGHTPHFRSYYPARPASLLCIALAHCNNLCECTYSCFVLGEYNLDRAKKIQINIMPPPSSSYWRRQFEQVRRRRQMRRIRERLMRQADPTYRPGMRLPEDEYERPPRLPESAFGPPIVFQYPVSLMLLSPDARQEMRLQSATILIYQ